MRILNGPICLGSTGEPVRALQVALNEAKLSKPLVVDGRFGRLTHGALMKFQGVNGLKCDGVVGPKTAAALGWNYASANARPYTISYEDPPLPPLTPPLKVVDAAIRQGMDEFLAKMLDYLSHAYDNKNYGFDPKGREATQTLLRWEDLKYQRGKLDSYLEKLENTKGDDAFALLSEMRSQFIFFIQYMHGGFREIEFLMGDMRNAHRALDRFPVEQIVSVLSRVLKGELTATNAVMQIQMAFRVTNDVAFDLTIP